MQARRWGLGAFQILVRAALAVVGAAACSSGSTPTAPDASLADATSPSADAAPSEDVSTPPSVDSAAPDAALGDATASDASDAAPGDADATREAGDGGCTWDGIYERAACSACLQKSCCAAVMTCEDEPACVALDQCVDACLSTGGGDAGSVSTCAQGCADAYSPSVRADWQALSNCVEFQCSNNGAGPCQ